MYARKLLKFEIINFEQMDFPKIGLPEPQNVYSDSFLVTNCLHNQITDKSDVETVQHNKLLTYET